MSYEVGSTINLEKEQGFEQEFKQEPTVSNPEVNPESSESLPPDPTQFINWVVFKIETLKGKSLAIPYTVNGVRASLTKPDTWSTYEQAKHCAETAGDGKFWNGYGFVLTNTPFTSDDLDHINIVSFQLITPKVPTIESSLEAPDGFNLTEMGNAERLLHAYGKDLKWCSGTSHVAAGTFYMWDGSRWVLDDNASILRMAQETVRKLSGLINLAIDQKWSSKEIETLVSFWKKSETEHMNREMVSLCRSHIVINESEFDDNPMLLGVQNGVINLSDGSFREPARDDLMTKQCNATYDPNATCPNWLNFLDETANCDHELVRYLQQCAGICLTGLTQEHLFFIVVGPAATGKTTFQETLKYIWGDYCCGIDPNSLAAGKTEAAKARPDIAKLRGVRLVFANESRAGLRLDEGLLKALSGGDTMTARQLYKAEIDFVPTHKLWLRTNNAPMFDGGDTGMQRRVRKVPFTNVCIHKDPELPKKLRAEADGILLWAIQGWQDYQKNGLAEPTVVTKATKEYLSTLDTISIFLKECCEVQGNFEQGSGELYTAYKNWMDARGEHALGKRRFNSELEAKRFTNRPLHGRTVWTGLRLCKQGIHAEDIKE